MAKDKWRVLRPVAFYNDFLGAYTTKRKTWKWFGGCGGGSYGGKSAGKYYKRQYHRAMRREGKDICAGRKSKGYAGQYSEMKWKGW